MRTFKQFLKGLGYHESMSRQHTVFFLISGLCLGLFFVYMALFGIVVGWGTLTGVLCGLVGIAGYAWLFMADYAGRGVLLHERDQRIAELESELSELRKK